MTFANAEEAAKEEGKPACPLIDHLIAEVMELADYGGFMPDRQSKSGDDTMKDAIAKVMADPSVRIAHLPIPRGASHYPPIIMKRSSFDGTIKIVKKVSITDCTGSPLAQPDQIPNYPSLKDMPGRYSIAGLSIGVTFKEEDSYNEILEMCLKLLSPEYLTIIKD